MIKNHCQKIENISQLQPPATKCVCYDFTQIIKQYYYPQNEFLLNWNYKICTELGYYQTLTSESQPFTNNLDVEFNVKVCSELFGPEFDRARVDAGVEYTNEAFGGLKPNVTMVVFTIGDLDPWSTISVLDELTGIIPAIVIPLAYHCRDILSSTQYDSEELKEARKQVKILLKKTYRSQIDEFI